jgi:hypothetical protein
MSTDNLVPTQIAQIIQNKRQALMEERNRKAEAEKREREETEAIGRAKHAEYIQAALLKVPEYLHQYLVPSSEEPDYYRLGKDWERPDDWLYFQVPGLAKFLFAPKAKGEARKFQVAEPYKQEHNYDGDVIYVEPSLKFDPHDHYNWTNDVEYALGCAQAQMQKYQEYLGSWEAAQEEIAREAEQHKVMIQDQEVRGAEKAARRAHEEAQEKAEEQTLFDAIKGDAIALNLLKAFVLLRDERSHFESQLEHANDSLYFADERASRQIERLHREAAEAERRAESERSRLQDDLDDAEKKLKKAERGW